MSQLTYTTTIGKAFAGMLADTSEMVIETRVNADVVSIPFGKFVETGGSVGDQGAVLTVGSGKILGPVVHAHNYGRTFTDSSGVVHGELDATGLVPKSVMNVLVKGRIWVLSETAAAVGDPVFVRKDTGEAGESLGSVANAADEADMIDLTAKARYITSVSSASVAAPVLAIIEVDMTA
jgi:hypothetical protein